MISAVQLTGFYLFQGGTESADSMEWDVSVIARRDSSESSAYRDMHVAVVAESAVPDTSRDAELAVRLSQELNGVRAHFHRFHY